MKGYLETLPPSSGQQGLPSLRQLLQRQVQVIPDATAISFEDGASLTYQELDHRASKLAGLLASLGVRREDAVAVMMQRSAGMVVGVVGVVKALGAWVPIDTSFPADRQAHIINDCGAKVVLVSVGMGAKQQGRVVVELGPMGEVIRVYGKQGVSTSSSLPLPEEEADMSSSLAYVIYTSGTTGLPKGVEVEQRGLVSILQHFQRELALGQDHTVLGLTTICFDISVLELLLPLVSGSRLCLVSSTTQKDGAAIADIIQREGVSVMQATPATYEMLMAHGWTGGESLHCLCGGEAIRPSLLTLAQSCKSFRNVYGPTETTIWSTSHLLVDGKATSLPIGTALPGTRLYISQQDAQQPVIIEEEGVVGELWIGGVGVARGYRGNAQLTAEKFCEDPFMKGERVYRTGDLCKWGPGGVLLYVGRADTQIKLNGYRIELGEVEKVLESHPWVGVAVVLCRDDCPEGRALVGYVKLHADAAASYTEEEAERQLWSHLSSRLPAYMLPAYLVFTHEFKLSPNGKIDRKALGPPVSAISPSHSSGQASSSDGEDTSQPAGLAPLICNLIFQRNGLKVTPSSQLSLVGLDSLGGNFLLGKLSATLGGIKLSPQVLYRYDTINDLALHLEERLEEERPDLLDSLVGENRRAHQQPSKGSVVDRRRHVEERARAAQMSETLTGLRGLLIVWVVVEHFMTFQRRLTFPVTFSTNTGLFLLLSGFATMLTVLSSPSASSFSILGFLRSRAWGLFPIYYLSILLCIPRYLAWTADPRFYNFPMFKAGGVFATDYSRRSTYAIDIGFTVTAMQAWVKQLGYFRAFPAQYYASEQWNAFLLFALSVGFWKVTNGRAAKAVTWLESRLGGEARGSFLIGLSTAALIMGSTLAIAFHYPQTARIHWFSPVFNVPFFLAGMATAYTYKRLERVALEAPATSRLRQVAWALAIDVLAVSVALLVTKKKAKRFKQDVTTFYLWIPLLTILFLLALLLKRSTSLPSLVELLVLRTELFTFLGTYSFPIYLLHETIADYYLQMGSQGLFEKWDSVVVPKNLGFWAKYKLLGWPLWIQTQPLTTKFTAFIVSVAVSWAVQHYVIDQGALLLSTLLTGFTSFAKRLIRGGRQHPIVSPRSPGIELAGKV